MYNTYYGTISLAARTKNFNVCLTNHNAHTAIGLHSHNKPYLCLLVSGSYKEKSHKVQEICEGQAIFRTTNYEHANVFDEKSSLCLNIELNNETGFGDRSECKITPKLTNGRGSIESYRALYALKSGVSKDLLEIYCHEALMTYLNSERINGCVKWIKLVQDYIQDNPHLPISLCKLSEMFNIHPNYVVRKFKESTGYRLSEYLTRVRIERSLNELVNSDESLTSIALNSGFYDQSHFNRNFKQQLEVSPSIYKKAVKG